MKWKHHVFAGTLLFLFVAACGENTGTQGTTGEIPEGAVMAPMFEVDPMWPKPLPNHWVLGSAIGVAVDAEDHVWIVHRGNGNARLRVPWRSFYAAHDWLGERRRTWRKPHRNSRLKGKTFGLG